MNLLAEFIKYLYEHIGDAYVAHWWPELAGHHLDAEQIYQLCVDSK